MNLNRRDFMTLSGLSVFSLGFGSTLSTLPAPPPHRRRPLAAVFGDSAYTACHEHAEQYHPPSRNSATVAYVNSLSEEQFLRRHYFS